MDNENKFILACDLDGDDALSVNEVAKAFPETVGLIEQVSAFNINYGG